MKARDETPQAAIRKPSEPIEWLTATEAARHIKLKPRTLRATKHNPEWD